MCNYIDVENKLENEVSIVKDI